MSGSNLVRIVFDGGDGPGFGEHLYQLRAEGWAASVAGLQAVEAALEFICETRFVDAVLLEDESDIVVGAIDCLHEVMLDLDVVVRARDAETCCSFEGATSCVVQFADQRFQIQAHLSCSLQWNKYC